MGTWYTNSAWTRLLIDGKSLSSRRVYVRPIHKKVQPYARLLERECYHRIDPDKIAPPKAMHDTVSYIRRRLSDIVGHRVSIEIVAWFLTVDVPKDGTHHVRRRGTSHIGSARTGTRRLIRMWR